MATDNPVFYSRHAWADGETRGLGWQDVLSPGASLSYDEVFAAACRLGYWGFLHHGRLFVVDGPLGQPVAVDTDLNGTAVDGRWTLQKRPDGTFFAVDSGRFDWVVVARHWQDGGDIMYNASNAGWPVATFPTAAAAAAYVERHNPRQLADLLDDETATTPFDFFDESATAESVFGRPYAAWLDGAILAVAAVVAEFGTGPDPPPAVFDLVGLAAWWQEGPGRGFDPRDVDVLQEYVLGSINLEFLAVEKAPRQPP